MDSTDGDKTWRNTLFLITVNFTGENVDVLFDFKKKYLFILTRCPRQNLIHSAVLCFILHLIVEPIYPECLLQVLLFLAHIYSPAIIPFRGYNFKGVNYDR